ncbi:MAG: DUF664 domain-containing protein [Chloroflexi bacterium]|nr:DUF664 domain-containing protein [Chloroflexota bacterium]
MTHPLVTQLRFARSEFGRGLEGVTPEEARQRFFPMNCLSWMVGHLANQENFYWLRLAQGSQLAPGLSDLVGTGKPASTPPWDEMWQAWHEITAAADAYLDSLQTSDLTQHLLWRRQPVPESVGTMLLRNIYHYWYHAGEAAAVRQLLGHTDLPQFVGNMATALYQPE